MHKRLDGSNIDDAALGRAKRFEEGMRYVEHAVEVDRDDIFPILDHGCGLAGKRVAAVDAGIVDQDRNAPDPFAHGSRDRDAILALGDIEAKTRGAAAFAADFFRGLLGGLLIDIEQRDLGAFAGVTGRDRAADAGCRTRDNGDMIFEQGHQIFP
jgi:hypothetical protein